MLLAAADAARDLRAVEGARPGFLLEQFLDDFNLEPICQNSAPNGLEGVLGAYNNNGDPIDGADVFYPVLASTLKPIGCNRQILAESSDASDAPEIVQDGKSGHVDFPFGNFTSIFTVGEYDRTTGYMPAGPPIGQGVYASDLDTLTMIFNSASAGHVEDKSGYSAPTWYHKVNGGDATFTGGHISAVDYKRGALVDAVKSGSSVAPAVAGSGAAFSHVYNLDGLKVDDANPHYGDTSAEGKFVSDVSNKYKDVWTLHKLGSGHLEEAEQWGADIGLDDTIYITSETTTTINEKKAEKHGFVGLTAHALDVATETLHATGAFGAGGFQKIVEFGCGTEGYVCFAISGYNGNFGYKKAKEGLLARRKEVEPLRSDGTEWVYPQHIVPARVYIGLKGYKADGTPCGDDCEFLERNGLAHGRVYGFAVPESTADRDTWHVGRDRTRPPAGLSGVFAPTMWQWDGEVKNFEHDQAWDFQEPPMGMFGYKFWTALGRDTGGEKLEHVSADPRGNPRFIQGSTGGYVGMYGLKNLTGILDNLEEGELPVGIIAEYELIEGRVSIKDRVELGGEGRRSDGGVQDEVMDLSGEAKDWLAAPQGLEWIAAGGNRDFVMVQEDANNIYGERSFIFELPSFGMAPTYYFLAQAGGEKNTRALNNVCVPAGNAMAAHSAEFHGSVDMSGSLNQLQMGGKARREAEAMVPINQKLIAVGLTQHMCDEGIIKAFGLDNGGQIYAFKPMLP